MGRPGPMQADHQADPHQEEHDQYDEHPLVSDAAVNEYPEGKANYQDPSAETNNMMNQQQQYPPAQNSAPPQFPPPQQNVNNPGRSYPQQTQQQPQQYPPAGNYPPQQQQYQAHQGPVQFPPTGPPPPVPISPALLKQQQFNNVSTTPGFPVQQQQTYQPVQQQQQTFQPVQQQHTYQPVQQQQQTFQPVQQQQTFQPVQQQQTYPPKVNSTNAWSTGLFDCLEDPNNALITALFPCLTFGQIAEILDNGQTTCGTSGIMYGAIAFCIAMPCLLSCTYRTKLRSRFDLVESPGPDWATHFLFEWCALCQAYRELKNRGIDPSIGWQGNQMKRQQQPVMMAPMNQSMMQ